MKLIDADALAMHMADWQLSACSDQYDTIEEAIDAVASAPTIDAVPVVRCKDCKRRRSAAKNGRVYWNGYEYYCEIAHYGVLDEGFCFYGERKDDDGQR